MSHRLQITLDDEQYEALKRRSAETGASIAALIRRALDPDTLHGGLTTDERLARLRASAGAWSNRRDDPGFASGADYVESIRHR